MLSVFSQTTFVMSLDNFPVCIIYATCGSSQERNTVMAVYDDIVVVCTQTTTHQSNLVQLVLI